MKSPLDFTPEQIRNDEDQSAAIEYLIALAFSPFWYHIDDDPHDIEWETEITPEQVTQLDDCTHAAAERLKDLDPEHINGGAWLVYGAAVDVRGNVA